MKRIHPGKISKTLFRRSFLSCLKCWVRDLHNWFRSGFSDFRGCLWRGYARHRGSCVMPLAWVGHEIWYKNKNRKLFQKHFFFDENFIFEEIWKSKILQKKSFFEEKMSLFFIDFSLKKVTFLKKFSRFFFFEKNIFCPTFCFEKIL